MSLGFVSALEKTKQQLWFEFEGMRPSMLFIPKNQWMAVWCMNIFSLAVSTADSGKATTALHSLISLGHHCISMTVHYNAPPMEVKT